LKTLLFLELAPQCRFGRFTAVDHPGLDLEEAAAIAYVDSTHLHFLLKGDRTSPSGLLFA
jgi:hypothetical protein